MLPLDPPVKLAKAELNAELLTVFVEAVLVVFAVEEELDKPDKNDVKFDKFKVNPIPPLSFSQYISS